MPGWWAGLGLPGLYDVHVHFLPPPVMRKVREQFDSAGPLIGRPWPLTYRGDDEERVGQLRALGVRRFAALPYAHRPGIAGYLNDWAAGFADAVPEVMRCATFYPEDGRDDYVAELVDAGTEVFKVHVQVGDFDLTDPLLDEAWGLVADAGTPVVVHANSGPVGNEHTGPGPMRALMRAAPGADGGARAPGCAGVRRVPGDRRGLRARAPRHHDGVHRLLRGDGAVPARAAAAAARPR